MYKNFRVLCTICARGGSKGIPGKNKAIVAGKHLIVYSLENAKRCRYIDDILISTNDDEIMQIVHNFGMSAPFKRPENLSADSTPKIEVIRHAVEWAERNYHKKYDIIIDLSITSPLRTPGDIERAVEMLTDEKADNVFSVSPSYRNPYYNMIEVVKGKIRIIKKPEKKLIRRQDAPVVYDMNDSINVWWKRTLFSSNTLFNRNTKAYIMPRQRGIDIDDLFDLFVVSLLIEHKIKM